MNVCQRCGRCCILPSGKDCRYLIRLSKDKTLCRIYHSENRFGTDVGEGCICLNDSYHEGWVFKNCARFKNVEKC